MKNSARLLIALSLALSCLAPAFADEPAPIVIPMGEPAYAYLDDFPLPSPSPAPQYSCTMPQETIRQRVFLALSFTKQGSHAKAQHVLQLLLNDL
jgi:hypothetical protein